ncbi:MAG: hypothetical protein FIA95_15100 [Gemmatimonadetes bacterium]|nr:hypothetical protein [Gemmatimonadota bacterium]
MGLFEFLMILLSVVIGLGMTEILTGTANLLRARDTVRFYWIHSVVQLGVFVALVQQWWESWNFHGVDELSLRAVMLLLVSPVFLFVVAHLLHPPQAEHADLRAYYYRQAPLLWGLVVTDTCMGTFIRPMALGFPVFIADNLSGIPTIAACVALAASRNPRVHSVLIPLVLVMVGLDTLLANPAITTG